MPHRHRLARSARLDVPAAVVYRVLADYREHHPHILPKAFSNLVVEKGGIGAGTLITFDLRVAGVTKHYRQVVTEPEPGRVLAEREESGTGVTSFTVDPIGPDACEVTIATEFDARGGLGGAIERWLAGRLLPRLYADELERLAKYSADVRTLQAIQRQKENGSSRSPFVSCNG